MNPQKQRAYWTMGFDYSFMYPSDEVYVAYTVPYTYTQLNTHIKHLKLLSEESRKLNSSLSLRVDITECLDLLMVSFCFCSRLWVYEV